MRLALTRAQDCPQPAKGQSPAAQRLSSLAKATMRERFVVPGKTTNAQRRSIGLSLSSSTVLL